MQVITYIGTVSVLDSLPVAHNHWANVELVVIYYNGVIRPPSSIDIRGKNL